MLKKNNEEILPEVELPGCGIPKILNGQKALVTGAGSGIGKAIAVNMGKAGADVMINYISDRDPVREIIDKIKSLGVNALFYKADISDENQVKDMFEKMVDEFGTVDILVNNAGIQSESTFEEMTLRQWQRIIDVNLTGQFLCSREAVKEFKRRGVVPEISCAAGKIICISSVHEVIPWAKHVNYAASKGGVKLMMKSVAQEVAPYRIRVNSIAPGAIRTNINREAWEDPQAEKELLKLIPYNRMGETEDVGRVAVWLASDQADYINGATIYVDGGMTLYPGFAVGG